MKLQICRTLTFTNGCSSRPQSSVLADSSFCSVPKIARITGVGGGGPTEVPVSVTWPLVGSKSRVHVAGGGTAVGRTREGSC